MFLRRARGLRMAGCPISVAMVVLLSCCIFTHTQELNFWKISKAPCTASWCCPPYRAAVYSSSSTASTPCIHSHARCCPRALPNQGVLAMHAPMRETHVGHQFFVPHVSRRTERQQKQTKSRAYRPPAGVKSNILWICSSGSVAPRTACERRLVGGRFAGVWLGRQRAGTAC